MTKENSAKKAKKTNPLRLIRGGGDNMEKATLNKVIHDRTRLMIVSALAVNDSLTFGEIKNLLDLSDGNLSTHAQKLEAAGYVECRKSFEGRMPKTEFSLTKEGKAALERYLNHMESLIVTVRKGQD